MEGAGKALSSMATTWIRGAEARDLARLNAELDAGKARHITDLRMKADRARIQGEIDAEKAPFVGMRIEGGQGLLDRKHRVLNGERDELREGIRASQGFRLTDDQAAARFVVNVLSIDTDSADRGLSIASLRRSR